MFLGRVSDAPRLLELRKPIPRRRDPISSARAAADCSMMSSRWSGTVWIGSEQACGVMRPTLAQAEV